MFERFTDEARAVVRGAQQAARERGDGYIGTEHLLLALVRPDTRVASTVLAAVRVTPNRVKAALVKFAGPCDDAVQRPSDEASQRPSEQGAHRPSIVSAEDITVLSELGIDAEAILEQARGDDADPAVSRRNEPWTKRLVRVRRGGAKRVPAADSGHRAFTKKAKKALECSLREALQLGDNFIGAEHMLLGLVRAEGLALEVLRDLGVDLGDLRQRAIDARPNAA